MLEIKGSQRLMGSLVTIAALLPPTLASAQIIPDNTLPSNSLVTPGCVICTINGGTVRGVNLYHSFQQFSVPTGGEAYFNNALTIQNILTRVTGANSSTIDGLLRANGTANLFLMNPQGIVFGPNARLDIGGTFAATTASSFKFFDGSEFSATNPQGPPLLAVSITPGLQYGPSRVGATIVNRGHLTASQDLVLQADQLDLQGQLAAGQNLEFQAQTTVKIRDTQLNPFIARAGGTFLIQGNQTVDIFALNHPDSRLVSGGNLVLRSANAISGDGHYGSGGTFRVEQMNGSLGNLVSQNDPVIRSVGDVSFSTYLGPSLHILAGGQVQIDTIQITGPDVANGLVETVFLSDGSTLAINGQTVPTVDIRAGVNPAVVGSPLQTGAGTFLPTLSVTTTPSNAGITINTISNPEGMVFLTNQYQPNLSLSGNITVGAIDTRKISQGGTVAIDTRGALTSGNINVSAIPSGGTYLGNAGSVRLLAVGDLSLSPGSNINAVGLLGGTVSLQNRGVTTLNGSKIISISYTTLAGQKGGDITVSTRSLALTNGAQGATSTYGQGMGGDITVQAIDSLFFDGRTNGSNSGIFSTVWNGATGNGGNITVTARTFSFTNGGEAVAETYGQGKAGNVTLQASDAISFDGISTNGLSSGAASIIRQGAVGNGGDVRVMARSLSLTNGAGIITDDYGQGNPGDVTIQATDTIAFDGVGSNGIAISAAYSKVEPGAWGNGGNVTVTARSLSLTNGAQIQGSTFGRGNAGMITVQATDAISFDGTSPKGVPGGVIGIVGAGGVGNGGNITIAARSISLSNGAQGQTSTLGRGNAGNLSLQATDAITFDGVGPFLPTGIGSAVGLGAIGNGGNITITARSLALTRGAEILIPSFGQGNAGNVTIQATDAVSFDGTSPNTNLVGSGILSTVGLGGTGNGGNIAVTTSSLALTNGSLIEASTLSGQGNGGGIQLNLNTLSIAGGSIVRSNTASNGQAGDILINLTGRLTLDGNQSAVSSSTFPGSTGKGGSILINQPELATYQPYEVLEDGGTVGPLTDPQLVQVSNQATISTNSQGTGAGGNITMNADLLLLSNQGSIAAATTNSDGGNIVLNIRDYTVMRSQSLISATAGGQGNGGNVTISTPFLLSAKAENSDIVARASLGQGGRIAITTQGIYGLESRPQLTSFSDINASSDFGSNGTVIITTPGIDPSQGLTPLPTNLTDPSQQIAQGCSFESHGTRKAGRFIITGRGGLPPSPEDLVSNGRVQVDLGAMVEVPRAQGTSGPIALPSPHQIVEMQGWVTNEKGEVFLVAQGPKAVPHGSGLPVANCSPLP